jgi:putative ABC transport system permease protein
MKNRIPALRSYWLMLVATAITVAIVSASQLVTQRIERLLDNQANELLAADLVIVSSNDLSRKYREEALARGLSIATTVSLRTALFIGDEPQLVELKAVSENYPLRGQLEIAEGFTAARQKTKEIPASGTVWVDAKLQQTLNTELEIGRSTFESQWLITDEPDRGGSLFNLAPRVLMNIDDLDSTELILPGSRVRYRLLVAGDETSVADFRDWLTAELVEGESIQDVENARPEMRRALDRTRQFFALSIVLTLVIAMVAIAITARYTAAMESSKVAVLRAFGVSRSRLLGFYLLQLVKLWLIAVIIGGGLGWLSQYPIEWTLDGWFGSKLPPVYLWQPFITASLVSFISLTGFCMPYLFNVITTPPMQVFRPLANRHTLLRRIGFGVAAILTVFIVLLLLMQSSKLAVMVLFIVMLVSVFLPAIFIFLIKILLLSSNRAFWLRAYLLSRLRSVGRGAIVVMSGFSLVLLSILLISVVKDEILFEWRTQLPEKIPNYFLVNIQKEDIDAISGFLQQQEIQFSNPYPLVRTRLEAINQVPVRDIEFADPRAEHLVNHTFNVSYSRQLPDDNKIIEGDWLPFDTTENQLSVELGMAQRLDLEIGDVLTLSVADEFFEAPVTSIRSVEWENFKPNFYLIANKSLIEDRPQTWLLSALIESQHKAVLKQLLSLFPAITLLDVSVIISRVRTIVDRATVALEFFFLFALASAFIVLLAAIQIGKQERRRESSLLRALAAQGSQLYRMHVLEFTLMGLLIGFFAALVASLSGWLVSVQIFEMDYHFSIRTFVYGLLSATLILTVSGILVSRKVYNETPMKALRW